MTDLILFHGTEFRMPQGAAVEALDEGDRQRLYTLRDAYAEQQAAEAVCAEHEAAIKTILGRQSKRI
jgi:hypothetical protein